MESPPEVFSTAFASTPFQKHTHSKKLLEACPYLDLTMLTGTSQRLAGQRTDSGDSSSKIRKSGRNDSVELRHFEHSDSSHRFPSRPTSTTFSEAPRHSQRSPGQPFSASAALSVAPKASWGLHSLVCREACGRSSRRRRRWCFQLHAHGDKIMADHGIVATQSRQHTAIRVNTPHS